MDFTILLQLLVNGLVLGVIYALIAMGLALIFGVVEIVNFAHGELYMLGAMAAYFLTMNLGIGFWPSVVLVTAGAFGVGVVLYEALLAPFAGRDFERSILLTLGLSMVLQNGAVFLLTTTPHVETTPYTYRFVLLGDARIPVLRLFALAIALVAFAALYLVLHHTRIGKAMRGVAQNRAAALMVGIDPRAAARLAEQAVLAEPSNAAYRVTLGEVYFDAGLLARAAGESARAIALAPTDVRASALAKLVAKGKRA